MNQLWSDYLCRLRDDLPMEQFVSTAAQPGSDESPERPSPELLAFPKKSERKGWRESL